MGCELARVWLWASEQGWRLGSLRMAEGLCLGAGWVRGGCGVGAGWSGRVRRMSCVCLVNVYRCKTDAGHVGRMYYTCNTDVRHCFDWTCGLEACGLETCGLETCGLDWLYAGRAGAAAREGVQRGRAVRRWFAGPGGGGV